MKSHFSSIYSDVPKFPSSSFIYFNGGNSIFLSKFSSISLSIFSSLFNLKGFHLWIHPSANSHPKRPFPLILHDFISNIEIWMSLVFPSWLQIPRDIKPFGLIIVILRINYANDLIQVNSPPIIPTIYSFAVTWCFSKGELANIFVIFKTQSLIYYKCNCRPSYLFMIGNYTVLTVAVRREYTSHFTVYFLRSIYLGSGERM